jgi:response regulator RpfG family c-di-GMP phosphodiesterase
MRMPNMNGATFLSEVRQQSPDTVRMILSGQAELDATIDAVNKGHIFRFLTKPCTAETLIAALASAFEQYRLVRAERDLLNKTLSGAVRMLTEIVGIASPVANSRSTRVQKYARELAAAIGVDSDWQIRLATMLSQLGCISVPDEALSRVLSGQEVDADIRAIYESHPQVAGKLLASIPRLEKVAEMVSRQRDDLQLASMPADLNEWDKVTLGAAVLRAATDLDDLLSQGMAPREAIAKLKSQVAALPEPLRSALDRVDVSSDSIETRVVKVAQLAVGMVVDEDVMSSSGMRLIPRGQEISHSMLVRLSSISSGVGIVEPIRVKVRR